MQHNTYFDSANDVRITRNRAIRELMDHGCIPEDVEQFDTDLGAKDTYAAQDVLAWLGY